MSQQLEDFGANPTKNLKIKMLQVGTSSRFFSHLLLEAVSVHIITCIIQEHIIVDRPAALLVLEGRDAMEYARWIEDEHIVKRSTRKTARVV